MIVGVRVRHVVELIGVLPDWFTVSVEQPMKHAAVRGDDADLAEATTVSNHVFAQVTIVADEGNRNAILTLQLGDGVLASFGRLDFYVSSDLFEPLGLDVYKEILGPIWRILFNVPEHIFWQPFKDFFQLCVLGRRYFQGRLISLFLLSKDR